MNTDRMNLTELHTKLIAAARSQTPDERVPYAFQTRVMARLREATVHDLWAWWAGALWRAAAACAALMVLLAAWSFLLPQASAPANDFAQDLENTVLAAAVQDSTPDFFR
jgi:hypothetical protein